MRREIKPMQSCDTTLRPATSIIKSGILQSRSFFSICRQYFIPNCIPRKQKKAPKYSYPHPPNSNNDMTLFNFLEGITWSSQCGRLLVGGPGFHANRPHINWPPWVDSGRPRKHLVLCSWPCRSIAHLPIRRHGREYNGQRNLLRAGQRPSPLCPNVCFWRNVLRCQSHYCHYKRLSLSLYCKPGCAWVLLWGGHHYVYFPQWYHF